MLDFHIQQQQNMNETSYRFKVGTFECTVARDGTHVYEQPASLLFGNAPQEQLKRALREHGIDLATWTEWPSPYPGLMVHTGDHRVLVDTGAGGSIPATGLLVPNLHAVGIAPDDIDTVILTHGHTDHLGGNVDDEGCPAFPNARYVMWKDEWEFWTADEPDLSSLPFPEPVIRRLITVAHDNLRPLRQRFDLVDHETEVVPGVHILATPGHTPGHVAVAISSRGEELLVVSDAMLHPIHLEQPGWYAAVDLAPEQALASRRRLLERAVATKALVHAFHFPWPGLGRVVQQGEAWQWRPVEAAG
jgi:glyoxylase-like metal-dependent hydrolase (beta-lactamase superfamily II)